MDKKRIRLRQEKVIPNIGKILKEQPSSKWSQMQKMIIAHQVKSSEKKVENLIPPIISKMKNQEV